MWDFETDPEYQQLLDWTDEFVRNEVEPLDLTDSLDQVDEAVYDDWCHTNELGARTVATAMWPAIREALDAG